MTANVVNNWPEANRRYLMAQLSVVKDTLRAYAETTHGAVVEQAGAVDAMPDETTFEMISPPALDELTAAFNLSPFERDILVLCAGVELDPSFARLCSAAQDDMRLDHPTFGLAVAALADAHWTATTPASPLRHWRLIEVGAGDTLTSSMLRLDERVLHYLLGVSYLDERLQVFLEIVPRPAALPASYRAHAERIVHLWAEREGAGPAIELSGDARGDKRALAAAACAAVGLRLHLLRARDVPSALAERDTLTRLWQREALLSRSALLIESDESDDPNMIRSAQSLADRIEGLLFLSGRGLSNNNHRVERIEVNRPAADEQRALWESALGPLAQSLNGELEKLVSEFRLDAVSIQSAAAMLRESAAAEPESLARSLWDTCRARVRPPLEDLAERIPSSAQWEDLVLPDEQMAMLGEITGHVRQRTLVYGEWGFAARGLRGLGTTALFAGPSGTGKTLAAEVLAGSLRLDLYRIDLSQVVSKYIGETEKNLRAVFDAAENSSAVLLFDEADALFGKRSEVKDSHDRYANIEVSYLLQRMEAYGGLAILTTNRRNAVDAAFLRRLRFIITFPFPDATHRGKIWERIFPPGTPTEGLDYSKLAKLNVAGGSIRNIALNAAFLAADSGQPVRMMHLFTAARSECAKMEKQATGAEIGGWV